MKANDLARNLLKPDITFYIDISPELAMQRINANRDSTELYETMENLEKVAATYKEAIDLISDSEKIVIINGNQNVDAIANEIWTHFSKHH
jgi:dTMP kinase